MKILNRILLTLAGLVLFSSGSELRACTSVIISGKYTNDGRPILWKHRDTDAMQNKMMYFTDGKYPYIGLVNSEDKPGVEVWAGTNSVGLSIMNTASYNLNADTVRPGDREGRIMKWALMYCATLADFEHMMDTLTKPYGVESNYGLIDAFGGAAFYETGNDGYRKIDANDPLIAPLGFLVHTNFSFSGRYNDGGGYIRFQTAHELFGQASQSGDLSVNFILSKVSRSLYHSLTKVDLYEQVAVNDKVRHFVPFEDFIPRYISSSSVVIQGIKKGEDPALTTMWTVLGWPLSSIVIPVWVAGGAGLPGIMLAGADVNAPLSDMSLKLKALCFPIGQGYGERYIDLNVLLNKSGTGILQSVIPLEAQMLKEGNTQLNNWRKQGVSQPEIQRFYQWVENYMNKEYVKIYEQLIRNYSN